MGGTGSSHSQRDGDASGFTGEVGSSAGTEIKKGKDDAGASLMRLLADSASLYDYAQTSRNHLRTSDPGGV